MGERHARSLCPDNRALSPTDAVPNPVDGRLRAIDRANGPPAAYPATLYPIRNPPQCRPFT